MQAVGARTYGEFVQLLEQNPAEFDHLCNTVLINVTAFFVTAFRGTRWRARSCHASSRARPEDLIRVVWSAGMRIR
jgi:chemotaxis methyl-accepting protein methylase